ncbi:MAG TPA: hypothetical protein VMM78_06910 [Thermomicrobiales bacterium]|nr:hypothetical protein [Thermomicrobiales bacterium]
MSVAIETLPFGAWLANRDGGSRAGLMRRAAAAPWDDAAERNDRLQPDHGHCTYTLLSTESIA